CSRYLFFPLHHDRREVCAATGQSPRETISERRSRGRFPGSGSFSFSNRPSSFAFVSRARGALPGDVNFRGIRGFALQETAIFGHIFVVFRQCSGKKVAALGVGHEVEI